MKTSITTADHAPQVVAEWLDLLQDDLSWTDRGKAYLLLCETLQALRDFMTVDEAVGLADELPVLIRGLYFEGWVPARTPARQRSGDAFLNRVTSRFSTEPLAAPDVAVMAVFSLLRYQIGARKYPDMAVVGCV